MFDINLLTALIDGAYIVNLEWLEAFENVSEFNYIFPNEKMYVS